jgi:hypothetical protein
VPEQSRTIFKKGLYDALITNKGIAIGGSLDAKLRITTLKEIESGISVTGIKR